MKTAPAKDKRSPAEDALTPSRQLALAGLDLNEEEEEALLRDDGDDVMDTSEAGASASWYDRVPPPPPTARGPMTPPEWKRAARPAHAFTPSLLARGEEK